MYRGWWLIGGLSITELVSWGILYYGFSVFLGPMHDEMGWSRTAMTGAFSVALLVSGIAAVPMGRWLDARGPRLLMSIGSIGGAWMVLAWSQVEHLAAFYLIWALIGLAMAATFYEPAFVIVANWFVRHRSRALTILTFGGGFASVVFIPLSNRLIDTYGWRTALVVLASILAAITIPIHALLLRRHPGDLGLYADGGAIAATPASTPTPPDQASLTQRQALRSPAFWWIAGAFFLSMMANVAATVHLIPYLEDREFSTSFAAAAAGMVGLVALPGRLIFTPLGGILPRRLVTVLIFSLQAGAFLFLALGTSELAIWCYVVLFGAGFGAITPARASLVIEFFGPGSYGSIGGVLALIITIARSIAPLGASLLQAQAGSYNPVIWLLFGLSVASCVAIGMAQPPLRSSEAPIDNQPASTKGHQVECSPAAVS